MADRIAEMVSSLERLGAETAQARDEAHRASASKSTFLATMSHEMRTPLNSVIGMTQLLEQTSLDGRQRELVGGVRQAGEALLALVGDLLDLTRIEAGRFELDAGDVRVPAPRRCRRPTISTVSTPSGGASWAGSGGGATCARRSSACS